MQNLYNLRRPDARAACSTTARAHGIAFVPWLPVAGGRLGEHALDAVAAEIGATPTQAALAWLLHRSPVVVPIPGTRSLTTWPRTSPRPTLELTADQTRAALNVHGLR